MHLAVPDGHHDVAVALGFPGAAAEAKTIDRDTNEGVMELPENVRPVVLAIGKYHFWILAVLVPLLVVPMLLLANGDISQQIDDEQSNIQSKLSAVQSVRSTSPHPNQEWADEIEKQTLGIRQNTWLSWSNAYNSQKGVREWPKQLGDQFNRYIKQLEPDGELPLPLRELYLNTVPSIVRLLPLRMEADDLMESGGGMGGMGGSEGMGSGGMGGMSRMMSGSGMSGRRGSRGSGRFGSEGGEEGGVGFATGPRPKVDWSAADQARIYQSFVWDTPPSTTQILLAQEELWVYGVLCDAIKQANSRSTGHYNAAIPTVMELLIGYQAAEDQPGGEDTGRITVPGSGDNPMSSGMGGGMGSSMEMMSMSRGGMAGAGEQQGSGLARPPHPRFGASGGGENSSSMGMGMSSMGMMGGATGGRQGGGRSSGSEDDALYNWIYVNFEGKPMTKSEIDSSPTAKMMRLMPFMLRIHISESKLDEFLVNLATQPPMPIDVRQVRINPNAAGGSSGEGMGMGMGMGSGGMGGPMRAGRNGGSGGSMGRMSSSMGGSEGMATGSDSDSGRPNDLEVEIRGTVALVAEPVPEVVGLTQDEIPVTLDEFPSDGGSGAADAEEDVLSDGGVS
jgi:hypothetical protein